MKIEYEIGLDFEVATLDLEADVPREFPWSSLRSAIGRWRAGLASPLHVRNGRNEMLDVYLPILALQAHHDGPG